MSDSWSVRKFTVGSDDPGTTAGFGGDRSEELARGCYERLVEKARKFGGGVELLKNGERVAIFEMPGAEVKD